MTIGNSNGLQLINSNVAAFSSAIVLQSDVQAWYIVMCDCHTFDITQVLLVTSIKLHKCNPIGGRLISWNSRLWQIAMELTRYRVQCQLLTIDLSGSFHWCWQIVLKNMQYGNKPCLCCINIGLVKWHTGCCNLREL